MELQAEMYIMHPNILRPCMIGPDKSTLLTKLKSYWYRLIYYSTNSLDTYTWPERACYLPSVHHRYPAIYEGCQVSSENLL